MHFKFQLNYRYISCNKAFSWLIVCKHDMNLTHSPVTCYHFLLHEKPWNEPVFTGYKISLKLCGYCNKRFETSYVLWTPLILFFIHRVRWSQTKLILNISDVITWIQRQMLSYKFSVSSISTIICITDLPGALEIFATQIQVFHLMELGLSAGVLVLPFTFLMGIS